MKKQSSPIFGLGLLVFLLLSMHQIIAQEAEDERDFDYLLGSNRGPKYWGQLREEWAMCSNGQMQSPIDLSDLKVIVVPEFGNLNRSHQLSNATLRNRGHDIAVEWLGDAGSIQINGTEYKLQQGHWHSPSEHTINGKRYDLELHMVHQSPDVSVKNSVVVVGYLYQFDRPDPFLSEIMSNITSLSSGMEESYLGPIHPDDLRVSGSSYYNYMGSLTVPPCDEGVIWIMDTEVTSVSKEQVKQLRLAVHDNAMANARPLQALNDRVVYHVGPKT